MGQSFSIEDVPDMNDKVCIITGANTGVELTSASNGDLIIFFLLAIVNSSQPGKECATVLAKKGAHVFLACRTASKTNSVIAEIKSMTGNDKVEFLELDLLSLTSVASCAETFKARKLPLHLLLNNAGVMACPFSLSADGLESQFATNHVGHFLLTTQLLPILEASAPSRIVEVSSSGHNINCGGLGLEDLNDPNKYNAWFAYGRSKLANILFVRELAKRLEAKGVKNVYVNANHPGAVGTDLHRHAEATVLKFVADFFTKVVHVSPEVGALPQMYLATSPEVEEKDIRGQYYVSRGDFILAFFKNVPSAKPGRTSCAARDDKLAQELWEWTVNTLKEKVPGYSGPTI
ncbi:hypothetical protein BC938DRAFT_482972 [Jimgerdemannia flammicorona]|uniref:Uncharacterized protein n=1 Tax=Jimgerdemannia flammicorona TaxID=994334 RepID=A0A433QCU5_9FUNG|nr:hypothetical protein BC938DRAFT_482972 [Jimgerdemannia flammicorona]